MIKMQSESKETVNIYLSEKNRDHVLEGASSESKYIILMNETLQTNDREHVRRIQELSAEVSQLEGDNARMEVGRSYMKGLLKNFLELDKMKQEIAEKN